MSTPRHPLAVDDLRLMEPETLSDLTAQIALSISRLRDSNAELAAVLDSSSAEDDFSDSDRAEFAASIAENEDFIERQQETVARVRQVLSSLGASDHAVSPITFTPRRTAGSAPADEPAPSTDTATSQQSAPVAQHGTAANGADEDGVYL